MLPLYQEPHFTFRFGDDRIIPRIHLEGVEAGRRVAVYRIDSGSGERLGLLATAGVGDGGWVDLPEPIAVRAGDAFVAVPGPPDPATSGYGSATPPLALLGMSGRFAVCKLPPGSAIPAWATAGDVFSLTRTADELSVVCRQELVPAGTQAEVGWRCLRVAGAMPFALVGVLASLTGPVAAAGVGVFAVSTFDTDYLLVKEPEFPAAVAALRGAGHSIEGIAAGTAGEGVRLRPVQSGDLPRLYELQLDPESNRMAATIPRTREAFDSHWATALDDPSVTAKVILVGEETVGFISCFPRDGQDHVGYWIDKTFWGKGLASRALHLLLREVTKRPLVATAATSNGASLRVLRKCGFVVELVRRDPATDRYPECEVAVHVLR
jgi:RimJ/RimL family protein N-acetyltransferase